jgi:hypothetical protein
MPLAALPSLTRTGALRRLKLRLPPRLLALRLYLLLLAKQLLLLEYALGSFLLRLLNLGLVGILVRIVICHFFTSRMERWKAMAAPSKTRSYNARPTIEALQRQRKSVIGWSLQKRSNFRLLALYCFSHPLIQEYKDLRMNF